MPNTYTQLYLHYVCSPKYREALITEEHRLRAQSFLAQELKNRGHSPKAVYCRPDHIHALWRQRVAEPISVTINQLKTNSSREFKSWVHPTFTWQDGGGLFSVSRWDVGKITRYIDGQREHHERQEFIAEYRALLRRHGIPFEEEYLLRVPIAVDGLG